MNFDNSEADFNNFLEIDEPLMLLYESSWSN